jgi:hypothetical protein
MKIFVTGFQRSGTTLLRDLISRHPDVKHMFHETGHLSKGIEKLYNSKELNDRFPKQNSHGLRSGKVKIDWNMKKDSWGEKIPYYTFFVKKGRYNRSIFNYIIDWNSHFSPNSAIIHIVRHPYDVGLSTKKRGFSSSITKPIKQYSKMVPKFIKETNKIFKNIYHIKYEDLLFKPEESLALLFEFCQLNNDDKTIKDVINSPGIYRFDKIETNRAFNFVNKKIETKINLKESFKEINKFGNAKYFSDYRKQENEIKRLQQV